MGSLAGSNARNPRNPARRLGESFPRSMRVRRRNDFLRAQRGPRTHGRFVTLVHGPSRGRLMRFGFTVSKKVGNAVVRNLVKRRLREITRRASLFELSGDFVLIAKPEAATATFADLRHDVVNAFQRATLPKGPQARATPRGAHRGDPKGPR